MYNGVVFDFNGTMVWDTAFHEEAWIAFSREFGKPIDRETYYRDVHGKTTKHILKMLLGKECSSAEIAEMSREKERLYREICLKDPDGFILAPGVEQLLDELSSHEVPITIATASERENVDFFIDHFILGRWFSRDMIVFDDGQVRNKPDPDIYLRAAENLGYESRELVFIEDSYFGVLAAEAAGCGYLIVAGQPTEQHERLRKLHVVSQFIEDFSEIDRSLFW